MKMNAEERFIVGLVVVVLVFFLGMRAGAATQDKTTVSDEPLVKYVEVVQEENIDTSSIERNWGGDFSDGKIKMVGAWYYAEGVVEDENGNLWKVEQHIKKDDFLLLWIADNHTKDNSSDDTILKVWREAY